MQAWAEAAIHSAAFLNVFLMLFFFPLTVLWAGSHSVYHTLRLLTKMTELGRKHRQKASRKCF